MPSLIYRVSGTPTYILIDIAETIIFRDSSVENLEKTLDEIFSKEI